MLPLPGWVLPVLAALLGYALGRLSTKIRH